MMLKPSASAEELKIYHLYLQRLMKEYDLIWIRFKVYLGITTGILVAIGFLVGPSLNTAQKLSDIPDLLGGIPALLSIIGLFFSIAWFLINKDGRKWMLFMNKIIGEVEDNIFENKECALYTKINEEYPPTSKGRIDVTDINLYVSIVFIVIWVVLAILSMRTFSGWEWLK